MAKLSDKKAGFDEMKIMLASLVAREVALKKCDADILDNLDDNDAIMAEIEDSSLYADKVIAAKTRLELEIQHHEKKCSSGTNSSSSDLSEAPKSSSKDSKIQIKLPPIDIGKYDGSLLSWSLFWDKFTVAVHSRTDLEDIQKYTYLKSNLVGEAKRAIQGISYDKDNYQNAITSLKARFGNKQLRISAHMKELQNIVGVRSLSDISGLRKMYDALEMNITNLKELDVDVSTYGSLLIAIIFDRIPEQLRIKISLDFGDDDWTLDRSMELIKSELEARERSTAIGGASSTTWEDDPEDLSTIRSLHVSAGRGNGRRGRSTFRGGRGSFTQRNYSRNFQRNSGYGGRSDSNRQGKPQCLLQAGARI